MKEQITAQASANICAITRAIAVPSMESVLAFLGSCTLLW